MAKNKPRKIIDARADSEGNITHVKIQNLITLMLP